MRVAYMPALFGTAFDVGRGEKASFHACMWTIHEGLFQSWQRHEWDGCHCLLRERQARKKRRKVRCRVCFGVIVSTRTDG